MYQFSLLLHLGHLDGGKTMLSPDNPLNATTFRKLPMQAPIKNTKIDISVFKSIIAGNTFFVITSKSVFNVFF